MTQRDAYRRSGGRQVDRLAETQLIDQPISADETIDEEGVGDEVRATLSALMPWGVSILAHVALIVLAFFLVWQTIESEPTPPNAPQLSRLPDIVSTPTPDVFEDLPEAGGPPVVPIINAITEVVKIRPGVGEVAPMIPPVVDQGDGKTRGPGKSDDFGKRSKIGPPVNGGPKDYAFVIDASGSMIDVLPFVINELKRMLNDQQADKRVTIIFFSGDGIFEVPGGGAAKGLRQLTGDFKQDIREWITLDNHRFDTGGRGTVHVSAAIARALSYKPEAIYLLSDNLTGGGLGATQHELMQDDLLASIHTANKRSPYQTRINAIQFLYEDPLVKAGLKGTLDRIAEETGGQYKFIGQLELVTR